MTARKPIEQKRLLGNPGRRALPNPMTVVTLPQGAMPGSPPDSLGEAGREVWSIVVGHAARWIAPTDVPQLERLARAYDDLELLDAAIARDGFTLRTDKGYAYLNPDVSTRDRLEDRVTKLSGRFGLTPADRSVLGLAEVRVASDLASLVAKRTGLPA